MGSGGWFGCNSRDGIGRHRAVTLTLASHLGQRPIVCIIDWVSGWSASIVHTAHATMSHGIKRPFCLDANRVTDWATFPIQSFENEALTQLNMPQTSGSLKFWLLLFVSSLSLLIYLRSTSSALRPAFILIPTSFAEALVHILNHITSTRLQFYVFAIF